MSVGIALQAVIFEYPGGLRALDGVNLAVAPGESLALVGQNGSGKSTLVRLLVGLLRPTAGRVLIDGVDAATLRVAQLATKVGLVFQDPSRQIFAGRVSDEVAFGPRNLGLRGRELEDAVREALEAVGLADEALANPYDLGASRRKLLAIASVLAMRTPAVVLDEPTTGQDARGVARVQEIVRRLATEGRTVIAVSHDMRFVAETFDRIAVLQTGQIVLDGTPAEVFAEHNWAVLAATHLEPPTAARLGVCLGLGSTPSERSLLEALRVRHAAPRHPNSGPAATIRG